MPEQINILGKPFPKPVVLAVGAGVAGIVGYAWWTRGTGTVEPTSDSVDTEALDPSEVPGGSGGTVSGTFTPNKETFETDSDWFNAAIEKLMYDFGISDTKAAGDALDRYLNNRPMSQTQADMIAFVINSLGPPPTGRRNVKIETPATAPSPVAKPPSNVRAFPTSGGKYVLRWDAVPGATAYEIRGIIGHLGKAWKTVGAGKQDYLTSTAPPKSGHLAYEVRSVVNQTKSTPTRVTVRN